MASTASPGGKYHRSHNVRYFRVAALLTPQAALARNNGRPERPPFPTQPDLDFYHGTIKIGNFRLTGVSHGNFRNNRKSPDGCGIYIPRDMRDSLVPNYRFAIFPAMPFQSRMRHGPADLAVQEPQRGKRCGPSCPGCCMRVIPVGKTINRARFTGKLAKPIRSIGNNHGRSFPLIVKRQCITPMNRNRIRLSGNRIRLNGNRIRLNGSSVVLRRKQNPFERKRNPVERKKNPVERYRTNAVPSINPNSENIHRVRPEM